jgi:hypothetical protein
MRIDERAVPHFVLKRLRGDALVVKGKDVFGRRVNLRIVRTSQGYWVGFEVDLVLLTIVPVPTTEKAADWFRNRLQNPEELNRVLRMPVIRSWKEEVTRELTELWCGHAA